MHLCVLIVGTVWKFLIARITVQTPHYKGELEALYLKAPIYDLATYQRVAGWKNQLDKDVSPEEVVAVKKCV